MQQLESHPLVVRLSSTPHLPLSLLSVADVLLDFLNPIGNDWTMARVETRGLHAFQFRERLHIRVEILKHLKMSIRGDITMHVKVFLWCYMTMHGRYVLY